MGSRFQDNDKTKCFEDTYSVRVGFVFVVGEMWGLMVPQIVVEAVGVGMGYGWVGEAGGIGTGYGRVGNLNLMTWAPILCLCGPVLHASVILFSLNNRYLRNNKEQIPVGKMGILGNNNNKKVWKSILCKQIL